VGPISYYYAFKYGSHSFYFIVDVDKQSSLPEHQMMMFEGMAVAGLWIGVCAGFAFQSIVYAILIKRSNWQIISDKACMRNGE